MALVQFPDIDGGWPLLKTPTWSTRGQLHQSGREVVQSLQCFPRFRFELTFPRLPQRVTKPLLQTMMGFFIDRRGRFESFLFRDPTDHWVTGQLLGAGNGSRTVFPFLHPFGTIDMPVGQVEPNGLVVYVGGTPKVPGTDYSIGPPNKLVFAAPVAALAQVTADYRYYFVCRFDEDVAEYENFMHQLWQLQSCKFTSVKL